MRFLDGFNREKPLQEEAKEKILPHDVRYALQYKEAVLNAEDIEALINNNFENEALYLVFKGLSENPEKHRALLQVFVEAVLKNHSENSSGLVRKIANNGLAGEKGFSVQASKLAQWSRQGFEFWQEKFKEAAAQLALNKQEIFLTAHSTFSGLSYFLKFFNEKSKTLNIIVPGWLQNDNIGYKIKFKDGVAVLSWLSKPFEIKEAVIVDDIENTGQTLKEIKDLLAQNGFDSVETFVINKKI